jgi:hypothetical protein
MSDYSKAVNNLKARWDASAARGKYLDTFYRGVQWSISNEVESANASLCSEGLPEIELGTGSTLTLELVSAKCRITIESDEYMIVASFVSNKRDKLFKFLVQEQGDHSIAHRADSTSEAKEEFSSHKIAVFLVEELIAEAP